MGRDLTLLPITHRGSVDSYEVLQFGRGYALFDLIENSLNEDVILLNSETDSPITLLELSNDPEDIGGITKYDKYKNPMVGVSAYFLFTIISKHSSLSQKNLGILRFLECLPPERICWLYWC